MQDYYLLLHDIMKIDPSISNLGLLKSCLARTFLPTPDDFELTCTVLYCI